MLGNVKPAYRPGKRRDAAWGRPRMAAAYNSEQGHVAALVRGGLYIDGKLRRDRIVHPAKNIGEACFDGGDEKLRAEMAFVRQP